MKQYIEEKLIDELTIKRRWLDTEMTETIKQDIEYIEETKDIVIHNDIAPYILVCLKRLIYMYGLPVNNIIVGTPEC